MARFTARDKIWNNALMQDSVAPTHYTDVFDVSEEMASETLETMHRSGLLERHEDEDGTVTYASRITHPKTIPENLVAP